MAKSQRTRSVPSKGEEHLRLEDLWDEPEVTARPTYSAAQLLQGAWLALGGRRQAELLISGDRFTIHFVDGAIYMGTFAVGGPGRPRTLDMHIQEGPPHHRGLTALCIYELLDDVMRWCTAPPGAGERPRDFAESDPRGLSLVFRREHQFSRR